MIVRQCSDLYPMYLPPPDTPRSEGIHVSSIIHCIATDAGILKPEYLEELKLADVRVITDPVALIRINLGLAWEKHYIPMLQDVIDHPGEMQLQGVYLTHDGESVNVIITQPDQAYGLYVHEVKCTYKSINNCFPLEDQWMWMAQIKAYCKALGTRFAFLHILFINGNYKFPLQPKREVYALEFTQEEIDHNWAVLMDYKNHRLQKEISNG